MLRRNEAGKYTAKLRESLYLDSAIIAKCGLFYTAMTRGRIITTVSELLEFNKNWAINIKNIMGYDDYYLAIKVEEELARLCVPVGEGAYLLTNEGLAVVLSEVQRYQKSKMTVHHFMTILDRMIKNNVKKSKRRLVEERVSNLSKQLKDAFGNEPFVSFNTTESGEVLSAKLLLTLCEIYNYQTYVSSPSEVQISELVRLITEREKKFHMLLEKTKDTSKFDSKKCLVVAEQIRQDKMKVYRAIYEHTIDLLDVAKINRVD